MKRGGLFPEFFGRIKFILLQTSKYYQIWTNGHICELNRQDELEFVNTKSKNRSIFQTVHICSKYLCMLWTTKQQWNFRNLTLSSTANTKLVPSRSCPHNHILLWMAKVHHVSLLFILLLVWNVSLSTKLSINVGVVLLFFNNVTSNPINK